jgi:hypothetical protein
MTDAKRAVNLIKLKEASSTVAARHAAAAPSRPHEAFNSMR